MIHVMAAWFVFDAVGLGCTRRRVRLVGHSHASAGCISAYERCVQAGAILRISLKNIRCHANLEFNLNPATNFIIGRNGSGKSSVLVGARLALGWSPGAKSGDVSVIKEGCQGAKAEIDLCNTGKDAYKPLEYGQIIRISREMPLASDGKKLGTSRWEIRNGITGEFQLPLRLVTSLCLGWCITELRDQPVR